MVVITLFHNFIGFTQIISRPSGLLLRYYCDFICDKVGNKLKKLIFYDRRDLIVKKVIFFLIFDDSGPSMSFISPFPLSACYSDVTHEPKYKL